MNKKLQNIADAIVRYILNTNNKNIGDLNDLIKEIFNSHKGLTYKTASQYEEFNNYINKQVEKYDEDKENEERDLLDFETLKYPKQTPIES